MALIRAEMRSGRFSLRLVDVGSFQKKVWKRQKSDTQTKTEKATLLKGVEVGKRKIADGSVIMEDLQLMEVKLKKKKRRVNDVEMAYLSKMAGVAESYSC